MKELSIDIETYSPIDLARRGVYKYAEHPDFSILLFGYAVDDGEVKVVDLAKGERIPHDILLALTDPLVTKWAFNASFERICLSRYLREHYPSHFLSYGSEGDTIGKYLDPLGWKVFTGPCLIPGISSFPEGSGRGAGAFREEDGRGEPPHRALLPARAGREKDAGRLSGRMGAFQEIQSPGRGSGKGSAQILFIL